MFECPSCHKIMSSRANLDNHIIKNVCRKQDRMCQNCGKLFKRKENCIYHVNQSVCTRKKVKLILKNKTLLPVNQLEKQLTQMTEKFNQMKGKYEALRENPQNINNIIVFPSSYGKEDIVYIRQKLGDIVGNTIKNHPFNSIPILFDKIHNNDQLPEYHNVYVNNERSNYVMVSDGKEFKYEAKKRIIDQIIEDKRSILNQYIDDNGEKIAEKVLAKYEKYQNQIDENSEFRKNLEVEIGGLLLNMKAVIANDEKTRTLLDKVTEGKYELDS